MGSICLLSDGGLPSVSCVTHYSFVRSFVPSPNPNPSPSFTLALTRTLALTLALALALTLSRGHASQQETQHRFPSTPSPHRQRLASVRCLSPPSSAAGVAAQTPLPIPPSPLPPSPSAPPRGGDMQRTASLATPAFGCSRTLHITPPAFDYSRTRAASLGVLAPQAIRGRGVGLGWSLP